MSLRLLSERMIDDVGHRWVGLFFIINYHSLCIFHQRCYFLSFVVAVVIYHHMNNLWKQLVNLCITQRLKVLGKKPLCNMKSERAPHIGRFCFFLCWRCTGIVVGIIIVYFLKKYITITLKPFSALFLLPISGDVTFPLLFKTYKPTNLKRFITGFIASFSSF